MITVPCKHQRMDCPACGRIVVLRWPVLSPDTTETRDAPAD